MDLKSLRDNQLSADGWSWYQRYLEALDAYDVERYAAFLAPDVAVQFGNAEPMTGLAAVTGGLAGFWQSIRDMGFTLLHEPLNIYGTDERFVLEALNHYDAPDGRRVTVRAVAFTERDGAGQVTSVRLYQDLSPLYQPAS